MSDLVVLDTDVVIDLMNEIVPSVAAVASLVDSEEPVSISVATRMQLFHGVARSQAALLERRKISRALRGAVEYPLTPEIAEEAGILDGQLAIKGERLDPFDTIIAATAIHHREALMTRNLRHFDRIGGLEIRTVGSV